jgi:predicted pyridoxine 5'-phosphate oxidase superfamily flavin-nucleotide-binding protein
VGRTYQAIDDELRAFVESQHVFFVATAPLDGGGHVNVSPKGGDTLRVLDDRTLAWLDLTGSGIETLAHLRENGRITLMWCAFEGAPKIARVHGRGEAVVDGDPRFADLVARFPEHPGVRSVVVVEARRISTSCGFGVPLMDFVADRDRLQVNHRRRGVEGLVEYRATHNAVSIDGLAGLS